MAQGAANAALELLHHDDPVVGRPSIVAAKAVGLEKAKRTVERPRPGIGAAHREFHGGGASFACLQAGKPQQDAS